MTNELSREDALRVSLGKIESYAYEKKLDAVQVEAIFNAGIAAWHTLGPVIFGVTPKGQEAA